MRWRSRPVGCGNKHYELAAPPNANNNFSAVVPYDMELQRKESKEFLDDLTTRDQRMMFAVLTMVLTADTKEQLDADTETVQAIARKHMCQLAVLKYQQLGWTEYSAANRLSQD